MAQSNDKPYVEDEKPACGWCGETLDSPASALDHLSDEHGIGGAAAVDAVYEWDWPDEEGE